MRLREVRAELQTGLKLGDRIGHSPGSFQKRAGQVEVRLRQTGLETQCFLALGNRFVQAAWHV